MWHSPSLKNKDDETAAMVWIAEMKCDVPLWMRHSYEVRSYFGNTLAMLWIQHVNTEPPEWMSHYSLLRNSLGQTCLLMWYYFCDGNPPGSIVYEKDDINLKCFENVLGSENILEGGNNSEKSFLQVSIEDYSSLKHFEDSFVEFLYRNNMEVIKSSSLYKSYKNFCSTLNYETKDEESLHKFMRKNSKIIVDNDIYYFISSNNIKRLMQNSHRLN
jgi:hypothetical protein